MENQTLKAENRPTMLKKTGAGNEPAQGGKDPSNTIKAVVKKRRAGFPFPPTKSEDSPAAIKTLDGQLDLLSFLTDNTNDSIFIFEPYGYIYYVNDRACRSLGYTRNELLGMSIHELDPDASFCEYEIKLMNLASGDNKRESVRATASFHHRTKDGHLIPAEVSSIPFLYGDEVYHVVFANYINLHKEPETKPNRLNAKPDQKTAQNTKELSDENKKLRQEIATRKEIGQKLEQLYRRYHLFFSHCSDPLLIIRSATSRTAQIIEANNSACEKLGYSREELLGIDPKNIHLPEDFPKLKSLTKTLTKEKSALFLATYLTKQGKRIPVEINIHSFDSPEGDIIFSVARDLTKSRQLEAELQESYQKESVLRKKLEGQIKQRSDFTRALVHELKTPLTSVVSSSEMLLHKLSDGGVKAELADNIFRGACSLNSRISELLDMAKMEIGTLKIKQRTLKPLDTLHNVINETYPYIIIKKQKIVVKSPPVLPDIWADEDRLRQILLNLINNAIKFNRRYGVITVSASTSNGFVQFKVTDEGVGISQKDQCQLFNPYFRAKKDCDRYGGLGLGLSLAKTLVELHNGKIWVKSTKGKGSTFGFSIPMKEPTS